MVYPLVICGACILTSIVGTFFVGLIVAGVLYYLFARSIDVEAERRVEAAEAGELETAAQAHQQPDTGKHL